MRLCAALCLAAAACSASPTTVLVTVVDGDAGPSPQQLTVDVFDPFGRLAESSVPSPTLPGRLVIDGLPAVVETLRVVVRGAPLLGGERVETIPDAQASVEVTMHASRLDSDGDGVPDDLDDCPTVPDPLQTNSAGSGPGNACQKDASVVVDQSMPDAAMVDAAVTDAFDLSSPPDLANPPSLCASAQVAFCDGFESGALAAHWNNNNQQGLASYAVDTTRAYRGTHSLKLHHDALAAQAIAEAAVGESQTFPSSDFFVRVFVYVPSPLPGANEAILFAQQSVSPYDGVDVEIDDTGKMITFNSIASPTVYQPSSTSMPLDQWVCVEWEVVASGSGTTRLWLDGKQVTQLSTTQNLLSSPPMATMQLGLSVYQPPTAVPAHDVWFDEVIIDSARIGCTK